MAAVLFTTFGSYGDLHPYIALGIELQSRGHRVLIATSAAYRSKVEAENLEFWAVRPDISLEDRAMLEFVFDKRRGTERVIRMISSFARETYADTVKAAGHADVIVTHPITLAAVLVARKLKMPWISSVLAPISLLSAYDPPVVAPAPWLAHFNVFGPRFMKLIWNFGRRESMKYVRPVLELRQELGLALDGNPMFEDSHSPDLVLALFSRLFAEPQPDWPRNAVVTGFPFYDRHHEHEALSPALERFLGAGPAPVVFTLGSSAVGAAGAFYKESVEVTRRLGVRALFLTGPHAQDLPRTLPESLFAVPYAPHSEVFPRAAVIVHQGGVGTTAQAMRSGRPMLTVPFAHDQFDNAERVRRLGAGEVLSISRYSARRATEKLRGLMVNPHYAGSARRLGEQVSSESGAQTAADAIEAFLADRAL